MDATAAIAIASAGVGIRAGANDRQEDSAVPRLRCLGEALYRAGAVKVWVVPYAFRGGRPGDAIIAQVVDIDMGTGGRGGEVRAGLWGLPSQSSIAPRVRGADLELARSCVR